MLRDIYCIGKKAFFSLLPPFPKLGLFFVTNACSIRPDMEPPQRETIMDSQRIDILHELSRRYESGGTAGRVRFMRKKYAWLAVVGAMRVFKRAVDIIVSTTMLIMLAPLFTVVALCIKLTDGGPILFWQKRVGLWGCEFNFPKFRSMVMNAEQLKDALLEHSEHTDQRTFKMKRDPRITWIGRIIRKFSIDELPQVWSVLKGDMSLVGPRPPVPREVALYSLEDRRRLDTTPGLTCIWQVSGRGDIAFPEQVELDVQYIESQSLWLDFKILFKTIPAVLSGRGAY
jgi:lipopolysaccharide/colanic/teichoic acid biosynthesis glycosyltransferase